MSKSLLEQLGELLDDAGMKVFWNYKAAEKMMKRLRESSKHSKDASTRRTDKAYK